eukprot:3937876-Rhodomonas_salina.10
MLFVFPVLSGHTARMLLCLGPVFILALLSSPDCLNVRILPTLPLQPRQDLTSLTECARRRRLAEGLLAAGQWQPPARRASVGGMPEEEAAGAECEVSAREGAVGGGVGDAKQRGEHVALQVCVRSRACAV